MPMFSNSNMSPKNHTPEKPKSAPEVTIGTPAESMPLLASLLDQRMDDLLEHNGEGSTADAERTAIAYDSVKQRQLLAREILEGNAALMA